MMRVKGDGVLRTITWNSIFSGIYTTLPANISTTETLYMYFKYNSTAVKWEMYYYSRTPLFNVVEDTTPQLGGNLDINSNKIVSTSNGDIDIEDSQLNHDKRYWIRTSLYCATPILPRSLHFQREQTLLLHRRSHRLFPYC